jgi:hypothetical protein
MGTPLFVWVLAAYPIAHLAVSNPGQVPLASFLEVLAGMLGIATVAWLVARLVQPSWKHAGLLTACFLIVFFAYGPLHGWLEQQQLADEPTLVGEATSQLHVWLSLAAIATIGAAWYFVRRLPEARVVSATRALNVFGLILLAFVIIRAVGDSIGRAPEERATTAAVGATTEPGPDIYYIILDGYARRDILSEYYGFDNEPFLGALRERGFSVAEASNSNYYWTFLSLSSSLNFDYLDNVLPPAGPSQAKDVTAAYEKIRNNKAAAFLRARGYRFVHLQSTWGATRDNPHADIQIDCRGGVFHDELVRSVVDTTWLKALSDQAASDLARCHQSNFASLRELGTMPGPKFVLAHFLPPHHPYLFDSDGTVRVNANLSDQFDFQKRLWEQRDDYRRQLEYVNTRILQAIEGILATSSRPPVIIVQSDHGPNLRNGLSQQQQLRIRFANLVAMHLPGDPPADVPADVQPVNLFRIVFNRYFDAGLPLLPARQFRSTYARPLKLCEVSGIDGPALQFDASDRYCAVVLDPDRYSSGP